MSRVKIIAQQLDIHVIFLVFVNFRLEEERKMLGLPEESKSNNPSETLRKYAKDPSSLPNDVMFSRKRTHSTSTNVRYEGSSIDY